MTATRNHHIDARAIPAKQYAYKLVVQTGEQTTEELLSQQLVDDYIFNRSGDLEQQVGSCFGWSTYAPEPSDQEDADIDRGRMCAVTVALVRLAQTKHLNASIQVGDTRVSLTKMEIK